MKKRINCNYFNQNYYNLKNNFVKYKKLILKMKTNIKNQYKLIRNS